MRTESSLGKIITFLCAVLAVALWTVFFNMFSPESLGVSSTAINLGYYISIYFIYILSYSLITKCHKNIRYNSKYDKLVQVLVAIVLNVIFCLFFLYEPKMFDALSTYMPWHSNRIYEFMMCVLVGVMGITLYSYFMKKDYEFENINLWGAYIVLACIVGYSLYQPNCFTSYYNLHHVDAVFNSVYRVVHGQPYSEINTGVYGYYGIILGPIVRCLGGKYTSFVIILCIMTAFAVLGLLYTLNYLVKNTGIRLLASIGIVSGYIALSDKIYYQNFPLRHIMPAYMIFYVTRISKEKKKSWLGYLLSIISIIWNFETGIGCTIGIIIYDIVTLLQNKSFKDSWKVCITKICMLPISAIIAYFFVNLYNMGAGGKWITVRTFLFPFVGSNQYMNNINTALEFFPSLWMCACFIILTAITIVINTTTLFSEGKRNDKIAILSALTSVVAIQMMYYINRTVYGNLYIVLPIISIIIGYEVEYFFEKKIFRNIGPDNMILRGYAINLIVILMLIGMMTISRVFVIESGKQINRSTTEIENMKEEMRKNVPQNTSAFGIGIPEIYSELAWDTGMYMIDFSDYGALREEQQKKIVDNISGVENVFVEQESLEKLGETSTEFLTSFYDKYEKKFSYQMYDMEYNYYILKEE